MFIIDITGIIIHQVVNHMRKKILTIQMKIGHGRSSQIILPQELNLEGLVRGSGRIISYNGENCAITIRSHLNTLEIRGQFNSEVIAEFSLLVGINEEVNRELIQSIGGVRVDPNLEIIATANMVDPNLTPELHILRQSRQGVKSSSRPGQFDSARPALLTDGMQGRRPMLDFSRPILAGAAAAPPRQSPWVQWSSTPPSKSFATQQPARAVPAPLWNLKIDVLRMRSIEIRVEQNITGAQLINKIRDSGLTFDQAWSQGMKILYQMRRIVENQTLRAQNVSNGSVLHAVPQRQIPPPPSRPPAARVSPANPRIRNIEILLRNIKACVENSALDAEPLNRPRYNEPEGQVAAQPSVVELGEKLIEFGQVIRKWAVEMSKLSDFLIRDPEMTMEEREYVRRLIQNNMDTARYTSPALTNLYSLSIPLLAPPPRQLQVTQPTDN